MNDDRDLSALNPGDPFAIYNSNLTTYTISHVVKKQKRYFVDEEGRKWNFLGAIVPYYPWYARRAILLTEEIQTTIAEQKTIKECHNLLKRVMAACLQDAGLSKKVSEKLADISLPEESETYIAGGVGVRRYSALAGVWL